MSVSLHKAVKTGNAIQVKQIIDAGGELNEKNIYGRTPLALAIQFNQKDIAKMLKTAGAKS